MRFREFKFASKEFKFCVSENLSCIERIKFAFQKNQVYQNNEVAVNRFELHVNRSVKSTQAWHYGISHHAYFAKNGLGTMKDVQWR